MDKELVVMRNEVSVFVMSISNSSADIGYELSEYLEQLQISTSYWTQYIVPTKVTHRGEELIVLCSGYATAYVLSFYISRIWNFGDRPYFGLSFGNIEEGFNTINIESWIHPLLKQARKANESAKNETDKMQFRFQLSQSTASQGFEVYYEQFETLLNMNLSLLQELMNEQTEIQSLVTSLYLMLGQQNKVSEHLGRTTSTISTHMKNGKTPIILSTFQSIISVLSSLEMEKVENQTDELQKNIRQNITQRLHRFLPQR